MQDQRYKHEYLDRRYSCLKNHKDAMVHFFVEKYVSPEINHDVLPLGIRMKSTQKFHFSFKI